eukprot:5552011-Pleurochrysis_carterae.AAC.3
MQVAEAHGHVQTMAHTTQPASDLDDENLRGEPQPLQTGEIARAIATRLHLLSYAQRCALALACADALEANAGAIEAAAAFDLDAGMTAGLHPDLMRVLKTQAQMISAISPDAIRRASCEPDHLWRTVQILPVSPGVMIRRDHTPIGLIAVDFGLYLVSVPQARAGPRLEVAIAPFGWRGQICLLQPFAYGAAP